MTENQCKYLKLCEEEVGDKSPEDSSNEWQQIYPKDSFERFGDDLSEVLLSYLSFEDKFRFECLSKQIQRLVFNKQTELLFGYNLKNRLIKVDIFDQKYIEFETMSQILKKCSNLRQISVLIVVKSMDRFMSLIIKYCHHLKAIEFNFEKISKNAIEEFCDKFGPQMKSIKITARMTPIKTILKSCPNLESLDILNSNRHLSIVFSHCHPFIAKLKSFSFSFTATDVKNIQRFVEYNKNTLLSIEVKISSMVYVENVSVLLKHLSKLSKLKRISFNCETSIDPSFVLKFNEMANNCPNIKVFNLSVKQLLFPIIPQFLVVINRFQNLKRFTFITFGGISNPPLIHSLKSSELIGCQQLTHLRIYSREMVITNEFFCDIDKYLPKLESIDGIGFITTNALESLSKLSNLKTIALKSIETELNLNKAFLTDLAINCPKLESIRFSNINQIICLNDFDIYHLRQSYRLDIKIKVFQLIYGIQINENKFSFLL